jgi:HEAT repeat protein
MTLERIEAVERATTAQGLLAATAALADCGDPLAVPCLLQVLGFNNPGAAVAAVDGLIRIGKEAVEPLLRISTPPITERGPGPCGPWPASGMCVGLRC